MNRKLKLAFLALLGFSTACSTVKSGNGKSSGDTDSTHQATEEPRIIAMYGVRPAVPYDELQNKESETTDKEDTTAAKPANEQSK